jgi:hypothetical protein
MIEPCFCGRCLAERSRYEAGRRALRRRRGGLAPCEKVLDRIVSDSVKALQPEFERILEKVFPPSPSTPR